MHRQSVCRASRVLSGVSVKADDYDATLYHYSVCLQATAEGCAEDRCVVVQLEGQVGKLEGQLALMEQQACSLHQEKEQLEEDLLDKQAALQQAAAAAQQAGDDARQAAQAALAR